MEQVDVLAVMAHPDDAELLCGGAIIKSVDAGERVGILDLTAGEAASAGTPESRAAEAAAAAEIMGITRRACAGLDDAAIVNTPATRIRVAEHLRSFRPRVVVTHWRHGRHPDHRVAAELVRDACFLSGLRRLEAEGDPHRPEKVVYALSFRADPVKPTFVVDVSDQMDRKIEALACFTSQFEGIAGIGEVRPAGDRPLFDQIRAVMAGYGALIKAPYGEPYWTDETQELATLGSARVPTF